MDNMKFERSRQQVRRGLITSASAMAISLSTSINLTKNSSIRAVEVVSLLTCGICIGAFVIMLVLTLKLKKAQ